MPGSITERPFVPVQTPYVTDRLTAARRPSSEVPSNMKWVSDDKDDWRQEYLIYRYVQVLYMYVCIVKCKIGCLGCNKRFPYLMASFIMISLILQINQVLFIISTVELPEISHILFSCVLLLKLRIFGQLPL